MKKKLFVILFILALTAAVLCGCSDNITRSSLEKQYGDGVTVWYNVGEGATISSQGNIEVYYYYSRGTDGKAQIVEPGKSSGVLKDTRASKDGCFLEGWYTEPEYVHKWNFSDRTADDITLYAKWLPNFCYEFYYVEDGKEVKLTSIDVGEGGSLTKSSNSRITRAGYTLLGLFTTPECNKGDEWDYSFKHPGKTVNGEQDIVGYKVYTKWIDGVYTLVSQPSDFLGITAGGNFYLLNDVDFSQPDESGAYTEWKGGSVDYDGIIEGNGYSIKGISLNFPVEGERSNEWGLFRTLAPGAAIRDVTFENISITVSDASTFPRSIGLLAGIIEEDVTFEDFKLGGKITVVAAESPNNYHFGLVGGEVNSSIEGISFIVDIDNRLAGFDWVLDETDPTGNEITFVSKAAA